MMDATIGVVWLLVAVGLALLAIAGVWRVARWVIASVRPGKVKSTSAATSSAQVAVTNHYAAPSSHNETQRARLLAAVPHVRQLCQRLNVTVHELALAHDRDLELNGPEKHDGCVFCHDGLLPGEEAVAAAQQQFLEASESQQHVDSDSEDVRDA